MIQKPLSIAIFNLLTVYALFSARQSMAFTCTELFLTPALQNITSDHFPESPMWAGYSTPHFSSWSAEVALEVSQRLKAGFEATDVLKYVAQRRQMFELFVTYPEDAISSWGERYPGIPRNESGPAMYTYIYAQGLSWAEQRSFIYDLFLESYGMRENEYFMFETFHTTLEGTHIKASKLQQTLLFTDHMGLHVQHTSYAHSIQIMEDVYHRIERFQATGERTQLLLAMRGYFQAMPYVAGSAAIGRIFFTGLYHSVTGRALRLPPAVDVLAMILNEDSFMEQMSLD
jgi:hypothetical protein